ncbi:MAG: PaaI family thioesterase [Actinobacteria bacterium]|nr:PaaI family thioesterase [Actinomycetota bacterium]
MRSCRAGGSAQSEGFPTHEPGVDPELDDGFREIIEDRAKHAPFYRLMGMEVAALWRGGALIRLEAGPAHLDESGSVHPGVIFALADAASGVSLATMFHRGSRRVVTVEMKVNFVAPAGEGALMGRGRVVAEDGEVAVCEAEVRDEKDVLVARSMATFMKVRSQ